MDASPVIAEELAIILFTLSSTLHRFNLGRLPITALIPETIGLITRHLSYLLLMRFRHATL